MLQTGSLIGPGSFFASLGWDLFIGVIMACAGILAISLGIKLLGRYRQRRSTAVLYLGLAFITFIIAMLVLLPTLFGFGPLFKIIDDVIARLVGLVGITFFLAFSIEMFVPRNEKHQGHTIIPLVFVTGNALLVLASGWWALDAFIASGETDLFSPILVIQELVVTLPFLYIFWKARSLAGKARDPVEKKALGFIGRSGIFMFLSYLSLAIDDIIVLDNPSSLPMWVFVVLGFLSFYIGVARPKRFFKEMEERAG